VLLVPLKPTKTPAVGVSISVLTLKQHCVVDVPAGVAVAFIAVAFVDRFVTHRARRRG
jgi:hypothetical protein